MYPADRIKWTAQSAYTAVTEKTKGNLTQPSENIENGCSNEFRKCTLLNKTFTNYSQHLFLIISFSIPTTMHESS